MRSKIRSSAAPLLVLSVSALAYLASLSNHLTEDAVQYAKQALAGGPELWHAHHLFYNGWMHAVVALWGGGRQDIDSSLRIMQVFNVIVSALTVLVLYRICRQIGARASQAAVLSLLFGSSSGFYAFSSQAEVYNTACLFLCLALLGLTLSKQSAWRNLLVGSGYFLAMGFHQVAVFLGIGIGTYEILNRKGGRYWIRSVLTVILPLAAMGACYLGVAFFLGYRSPRAIWNWMTFYHQLGLWGKGDLSLHTLHALLVGAGFALVDVSYEAQWMLGLAALLLILYIATHASAWRRPGPNRRLIVALLCWLAIHAAFVIWWDAGNPEEWILACVPFFVILAAMSHGAEVRAGARRLRRLGELALAACLLLTVLVDAMHYQRDQAPNVLRETAQFLSREARAGDVIIAPETDKASYYALYTYGRGNTIEMLNVDMAIAAMKHSTPATFTEALIDEFAAKVQAAGARGARCLTDDWTYRGKIRAIRYVKDLDLGKFHSLLHRRFVLTPLGTDSPPLAYEVKERDRVANLP